MRYQLYREQQLRCDIETAWSFFSSPMNLSKITPEEMGFIVVSNFLNEEIYKGMIIDYKVSPVFHIPLKWRTRITQVDKNKSFTDFQEKGPYKYWNHFHEFIPNDQGILMKDTVNYELPAGFLGRIAHRVFVRRKLEHIFEYRYQILEKVFNQKKTRV
ncbi:SRPBCC family protein [Flavobacterium sp. WV_118_3]|uniref:SRPBCC family protein n=1 Tax=Flavobacterium sp. WV_118_3 TaxID=3151764 RepID=UPI00321BD186